MTEIKVTQDTEDDVVKEITFKYEDYGMTLPTLLEDVIRPMLLGMGYSQHTVDKIIWEEEATEWAK